MRRMYEGCLRTLCCLFVDLAAEDAAHAERDEPVLHPMYPIQRQQGREEGKRRGRGGEEEGKRGCGMANRAG